MSIWQQLRSSVQRTTQLVLGLSIVTNIAMIALPLYSLQIFDRVLTSSSLETLWMLLAGVVIIGVTGICFEHLRRNAFAQLSFYLEKNIFPILAERMNLPGFNENKRELLDEYNFTQKQIQSASALVFIDALLMPLFIVITYFIHPLLGLFTMAVNALLILMVVIKYKWQLPKQADFQTERSNKQSKMLSNTSALAWLTMTVNNQRWFASQSNSWQSHVETNIKNELPVTIITNLNQCIRWLAQAGLPTLGAMLLLSNEITTGGFIAGLIIGGKTFMPVEALIANLDSFRKMKVFYKKIKTILEPSLNNETGYQAALKGSILITELELNNSQHSSHPFNLTARSGDTVAIIGPAGAGQDTIIRQLMGYESISNGTISIDGIRIEDWDKQSLYLSIGFVSGSIQLPEVSINSLITSFGLVPTTTAIGAAKRTGLNAKLIEWDLSYDEIFKSEAVNPTANQSLRQLIALTTAIAKEPQLFVLDNPETHLDMDSLGLLKEILLAEKEKGKTIILTTQSKALLQLAEHMVLLNKGQTLFSGKPNDYTSGTSNIKEQKGVSNVTLYKAANQASVVKQSGAQQ